jgi:hypothetical protein
MGGLWVVGHLNMARNMVVGYLTLLLLISSSRDTHNTQSKSKQNKTNTRQTHT